MAKIAFIGLGNMGRPMAANLVKAGHEVLGYDLSATGREEAAALGVHTAPTLAKCVSDAQVVMTMLPAGKHVIEVISEALLYLQKGALVIDSSTIDPESARNVHHISDRAGMLFLDAPVSGGVNGAHAATLTFMVGGDPEAVQLGGPILSAIGSRIVHCGPPGAGQAAKICNNMITGISMIAVSEAFTLAEKLGLSERALFDVASTSSGQCWALNSYCPAPGILATAPSSNGYKAGFSVALMLKDLRLAQAAANGVGAATPLGAQAAQIYALYAQGSDTSRDFSSILEFVKGQQSLTSLPAE